MANAGSVEIGEAAAADGEIAEHRRRSACQLRDAAVALLQARRQSAEEGTQGGAMAITAAAFEVSLDFLVGDGKDAHYNKKTLQIIEDIEALEPTTKDKLYFLVNAIIRDSKTKQAYL